MSRPSPPIACNRRLAPSTRLQLVWGKGVATPSGVEGKVEKRYTYQVRPPFTGLARLPEMTMLTGVALAERFGGEAPWRLALQNEDWPALAGRCPSPCIASAPAGQALPDPVDEVHLLEDAHQWLVRQGDGVDLAQGAFALRQSGDGWRRWRPLAGVLALCFVLQWGFTLAQGWYLQREADAYAASSEALYRELFPQDSKLINLRTQFDQHLAQSTGGDSPVLGLLAEVAAALQAEGAALVQVNQLDYSATRGDLSLQLQAPDFAELERLRERLEESGLSVQMGSASREAEGVSARVVIGG